MVNAGRTYAARLDCPCLLTRHKANPRVSRAAQPLIPYGQIIGKSETASLPAPFSAASSSGMVITPLVKTLRQDCSRASAAVKFFCQLGGTVIAEPADLGDAFE
jgi:hypothetical protein